MCIIYQGIIKQKILLPQYSIFLLLFAGMSQIHGGNTKFHTSF